MKRKMRKLTCLVFALVCAMTPLLLTGCGDRESEQESSANADDSAHQSGGEQVENAHEAGAVSVSPSGSKQQTALPAVIKDHDQAGILAQILKLWDHGSTEQAVKTFLLTDWENPHIFSGIPTFSLTEKEFAALPESERNEVRTECHRLVRKLSAISKHITGLSKTLIVAAEFDKAEQHLTAVQRYGKALADANTVLVIKGIGPSIQTIALRELVNLYSQKGDQARLQNAREMLSDIGLSRASR